MTVEGDLEDFTFLVLPQLEFLDPPLVKTYQEWKTLVNSKLTLTSQISFLVLVTEVLIKQAMHKVISQSIFFHFHSVFAKIMPNDK